MSKEEKAKEYAMLACGYYAPDCKSEYCNSKCQWFINSHVHENVRAYRNGYTAAEQNLSSQLTAYKEALRELVELTDKMENAKTDIEYNIASVARKDIITKAKTLIE